MKQAWLRYVLQAALWVLLYFFPYLLSFDGPTENKSMFRGLDNAVHLVSSLLLMVYSYLNYYWLAPRFYFGKKYLLYVALLAVCLAVVIKVPQLIDPSFGKGKKGFGPPPSGLSHQPGPLPDGGPPNDGPPDGGPPDDGGPSILFGMNYNIILFLVSTFVALSLRQRVQLFQIEKEKLNAELSFLKAQINPHFLFNTLNSIYSLALIKSDETPKAITQLSELMRYIMRDSQAESVPLEKELAYIRNYIALQQSRLGDTVAIAYEEAVTTSGKRIAPLLLMSFIENAFKHGVNPDEDSEIEIKLWLEDEALHLYVRNNKIGPTHKEDWTGIGLQNTTDRLQHLYPGKHKLVIDDNTKTFTVNLTLYLS